MAVTGVHKNWELFYSNLKFYFRHSSRWQRRTSIQQYSWEFAARIHDEWVNIDEVEKLHRVPSFDIPPVEDGMGGWGGLHPGSPRARHLPQYSESQCSVAVSQKEINLTLKHWGLHLFVKDVRCCLNDYANSSKPTCSWHTVPLHWGSSSQTHDWTRPTLGRARSG